MTIEDDPIKRQLQMTRAKARKLIATAEAEDRDFTADEATEFDQLEREMRRLGEEREAARARGDFDLVGRPLGRPANLDPAATVAFGQPLPEGRSFAELWGVRPKPGAFGAWLAATVRRDHQALAELRDGDFYSTQAGDGFLPRAALAELMDAALAASVVRSAGARVIPLEEGQNVGAVVQDHPTVGWRAEGQPFPESKPTVVPVTFAPKTAAVLSKVSVELAQDSPEAQQLVVRTVAQALAAELDRVALLGSGIGEEPRGLLNVDGVPTGPTAGPFADWGDLLQQVSRLASSNHPPGRPVMHPGLWAALNAVQDLEGRYKQPPQYLNAHLPAWQTTRLPAPTGATVVVNGEWRALLIGVRAEPRVQVLHERFADSGEVGVAAMMRADIRLARPQAFDVIEVGGGS